LSEPSGGGASADITLVRVVTFVPREGRAEELATLLRERVLEVNRRFGAASVQCLVGEREMAIVSVWARAEDLEAMRADAGYQQLLGHIRSSSDDLTDDRYRLLAQSPA
jgi:hypothetical protein